MSLTKREANGRKGTLFLTYNQLENFESTETVNKPFLYLNQRQS